MLLEKEASMYETIGQEYHVYCLGCGYVISFGRASGKQGLHNKSKLFLADRRSGPNLANVYSQNTARGYF